MFTHLLDTSAWIVHLQREPGWELISGLLRSDDLQVGISALSLVELHARLRSFGRGQELMEVVEDYRDLLSQIVPVNEAIALRATVLRDAADARLPAIDSMIAATAAHHGATLVHRDAHFLSIPDESLTQLQLGQA